MIKIILVARQLGSGWFYDLGPSARSWKRVVRSQNHADRTNRTRQIQNRESI